MHKPTNDSFHDSIFEATPSNNTETSSTLPLHSLLEQCETARCYYSSLPDYVLGAVNQHADSICTEQQLHRCADQYRQD